MQTHLNMRECPFEMRQTVLVAATPTATPSTATIAVDDFFSVPADRLLQTNVSFNDVNASPLSSYAFFVVKSATYTTPASSTPVALSGGLAFGTGGVLSLNPFLAGSLKPGTQVTFVYNIQPQRAGVPRTNNATVIINITEPSEFRLT